MIVVVLSSALTVSLFVALSGLAISLHPSLRRWTMLAMPVVLGTITALGAAFVAGRIESSQGAWAIGSWLPTSCLEVAISAVLVVGVPVVAFRFESMVAALWYGKFRSHGLDFLMVKIPGRFESMGDVAAIAQRPRVFLLLSCWSAAGEEMFYRGALMLLINAATGDGAFGMFWMLQALFYGANHVAFGMPAVVGKAGLGAALGILAHVGGIVPALLAHVYYQVLVMRQFNLQAKGSVYAER